jgi:FkbH-like protein
MKLIDIIDKNRKLELVLREQSPEYSIAVIANVTLVHLKDILELRLRERGVYAKVTMGEYNTIVRESIRFADYDAVIVFWEPYNFTEGFSSRWAMMHPDQLRAFQELIEIEIRTVLSNLKKVPLVLFNKFTPSTFCSNVLHKSPLTTFCESLNITLFDQALPCQIVVDLEKIIGRIGYRQAFDLRQLHSSMALYSLDFLKEYVESVMPALLVSNGVVKKVLVLDCDNTLWGGVIGEDGLGGIELGGETSRGKVFQEVQTIFKGLKNEGVLLTLCSKNDQFEVDEVFSRHQNMVLTDDDIICKKVNWSSKVDNIINLSSELNLGLESFVFIDDSPFEIGLVERELPQVTCIRVPEEISDYPEAIRNVKSLFFKLSSSDEDSHKTELYRQEQLRKNHQVKFHNVDEYLRSLGLKIHLSFNEENLAPRIAQMTQKTNQFNLTTKRYTEGEIIQMISNPTIMVVSLAVEDRFGKYGITGLAIVHIGQGDVATASIDSFLMSCRILGRNIEYRFFDELVVVLRSKGVEKLTAKYISTTKNSQVSNFYEAVGFDITAEISDRKTYNLLLQDYISNEVDYIKCHSGNEL